MKKKNVYYDTSCLSERIEDLRKRDGKNKLTLEELSALIQEVTGDYISFSTLSGYENKTNLDNIRIYSLLAIANTFDVSIDYLLGKTNSKRHNVTDQMAANKYGLSDKSLIKLTKMSSCKNLSDNEFKLKLINYIIEDDLILTNLLPVLFNFYKATDNKNLVDDKLKAEYDISTLDLARYSAIKNFEQFLDNSYSALWYKEKNTLFEVKKPRKNNKKKK